MNTSPFCTINTGLDPPFITVNEFRTMGINIDSNMDLQEDLRNSYDEICNECLSISDETVCDNHRYCRFLRGKEVNHDQIIDLGGNIEPYHCDIPILSENQYDNKYDSECIGNHC